MEGIDILEKIRKSEAKDDEVIKAVEEMKKTGVKMLRDEEWREKDDLMLKEGKVYVPKDEVLRVEIIRLYHDTPMGGHRRQWKTAEMVTRNFWWPCYGNSGFYRVIHGRPDMARLSLGL